MKKEELKRKELLEMEAYKNGEPLRVNQTVEEYKAWDEERRAKNRKRAEDKRIYKFKG